MIPSDMLDLLQENEVLRPYLKEEMLTGKNFPNHLLQAVAKAKQKRANNQKQIYYKQELNQVFDRLKKMEKGKDVPEKTETLVKRENITNEKRSKEKQLKRKKEPINQGKEAKKRSTLSRKRSAKKKTKERGSATKRRPSRKVIC